MSARVAIIILNWNSYQMTSDCIRSLQAMDSNDYEIAVVDNGSSDGSPQSLARDFPLVTVLPQYRNLGFAAGCNVGIRHALTHSFDFILLLNNDTHVASDFMREMRSAIAGDARIAVVCPKIYFADCPKVLWFAGADFNLWTGAPKHRGWKKVDSGQFDNPRDITQATGCAMLVRCSVLREVGLLDEQFWAYIEDLDWSIRFLQRGFRLAFAPRARLWHREGFTSVRLLGSGSQAIRQFFSTRNMIFLARKHVRWWQVPTYMVGFTFTHIAFYAALRLWQRDFRAFWAIFTGLREGFQTSLNSEWSIGSQQEEVVNANRN